MKLKIVELGTASKQTRDFSGHWGWDNLVMDFRKRPPID